MCLRRSIQTVGVCSATLLFIILVVGPPGAAAQAVKPARPAAANTGQVPPPAAAKPSLGDIDTFVAASMKDWKVPGSSIAVVADGKVIMTKGYGLRDVKANLPVTPKTVFAIGSITKSFTVTLLGSLVDEGRIDWDTPVRRYLPGFEMYDPVVTERLSVRDLVTHRSGLPRHDALWYNSPLPRAELVRRIRFLEPSKDLRTTYQYNNLMFLTAGYLAEQVGGATWEDLVQRRIFGPLGMSGSNTSVIASQQAPDFAKPYELADKDVKEVPFRNIDQIGPAGSINSNAEDMARYLLMHVGGGKSPDGKTIVSEGNLAQMQVPQMVTQGALRWPELGHAAYGMAWMVSAYRGHTTVQHGGAIDGFLALVTFLPREKLGVVVLSNLGGGQFIYAATYNVLDRLLGVDQVPWNRRYLDDRDKQEAAQADAKKQGVTQRREGTGPSHPLADFLGEYEHPGYGVLKIDLAGDALSVTYNNMTSPLRHFHYDIFEVPENPLDPFEKTKVSFTTTVKGDIGSVAVPLEPTVKDIVFTRRAETRMRERAFLEPLAGVYEVGAQTITFALRGEDTLALVPPGQPERELIPVRGLTFDVKGMPGFSVEFRRNPAGAVTEVVFYQPGGTYLGRRK